MSLIEDENLVAIASRGKDSSLSKVTSIIDTIVASSIDFDDIQRT